MVQQLRNVAIALCLGAFLLPAGSEAQLREIVAKSVSASSSGAELRLEFADDDAFALTFEGGTLYRDGETLGTYEPGGSLDAAWRALLGDAMGLENGALAEMLAEWSPPSDASDAGQRVDEALEEVLTVEEIRVVETRIPDGEASYEGSLRRLLVEHMERLGVLQEALSGLDDELTIHVDEDVVVPEGTVLEGTVVVIEGSLRVEGGVEGAVVVVGGQLDVRDGGYIDGEVRVADARIVGNRGEIRDGIVDVLEDERDMESDLRARLRDEIREEIRSDLRHEIRNVTRMRDDSFSIMSPFRPIIRGVGGVLEKLVAIFLLGLLGAGFLAFAGENVDTIAETARKAPARAAMVGFAGSFLLIPVWILGTIALAVSIIGIPVAIAWLPLFPIAAGLAGLLGYVAVARNTGEWLADSTLPWTGWIRKSNPVFTLFGGLVALMLAFMTAHVISIAPFLDILSGLVFALGVVVTVLAVQVGFGAVLLTRGGRRREYEPVYDADAAWEAAMQVDLDDDPISEPADPTEEEA